MNLEPEIRMFSENCYDLFSHTRNSPRVLLAYSKCTTQFEVILIDDDVF